LDTNRIVEELKKERARLDRAIAALDESVSPRVTRKAVVTIQHPATITDKRRGVLTPEGRKRLSLAMKKRWAERRKQGLKKP
jgi:Spy/CpxP family protein refolding chaperone